MRVEPGRNPRQQIILLSGNGLTFRFQKSLHGVNVNQIHGIGAILLTLS
jgi:hypothetical protein